MPNAKLLTRRAALCLSALLLLSGCRWNTAPGPDTAAKTSGSSALPPGENRIRIGYQKATALDVLRLQGSLDQRLKEQGVTIEWLGFPAGPQTLEAMNGGSVDLSSMGDSPPIFAQAAGIPLVYVANQPPGDGASRAILVAKDSPIRSVKDLKGKQIAVQKASGTHNFLIQTLEKAGIPYDSVTMRYLAPADGRAAFESGKVDAWAIWDPFLAAVEEGGARVLVDGNGIVTSGDFYLASRAFAVGHPDWIKATLEEVDKTAKWIDANPRKAAELLAPSLAVSVDKLEVIQARAHRGATFVGYRPMDDTVAETQQKVADVFLRVKLLPKRVNIREAMLTPEQYVALMPAPSKLKDKVSVAK